MEQIGNPIGQDREPQGAVAVLPSIAGGWIFTDGLLDKMQADARLIEFDGVEIPTQETLAAGVFRMAFRD